MSKRMFKKGDKITFKTKSRGVSRKISGVVRTFVPAGKEAKIPSAARFRGTKIAVNHDRYLVTNQIGDLVEILSPTVKWLEENAKRS